MAYLVFFVNVYLLLSTGQEIGCEEHHQNDIQVFCEEWDMKPELSEMYISAKMFR